jgi:hypothetical protein
MFINSENVQTNNAAVLKIRKGSSHNGLIKGPSQCSCWGLVTHNNKKYPVSLAKIVHSIIIMNKFFLPNHEMINVLSDSVTKKEK